MAAEITSFMSTAQYKWEGEDICIKGYLEYEEYRYLHTKYKYAAPVLGDIDTYAIEESDRFVIANANTDLRKQFAEKLSSRGARFINVIHPSCMISPTADIGVGNILSPDCHVGPIAKVGNFNVLTTGTMISHDCVVGDYNSFSSVIVCGHVTIGSGNSFFIRSTVVPHVSIGSNCTIQAGMVVDKNVPDGTTVFYKYKERIMAILQ